LALRASLGMCEGGYNISRREESKKPEFLLFINVGE